MEWFWVGKCCCQNSKRNKNVLFNQHGHADVPSGSQGCSVNKTLSFMTDIIFGSGNIGMLENKCGFVNTYLIRLFINKRMLSRYLWMPGRLSNISNVHMLQGNISDRVIFRIALRLQSGKNSVLVTLAISMTSKPLTRWN